MDPNQFDDALIELYRGERAGALTLQFLGEFGLSGEERSLAQLFAAVETAVGDRLESLARRRGLPVDLDEEHIHNARMRAQALGSWDAVVHTLGEGLNRYVMEFQALRGAAPEAERQFLDLLVDHEVALIRFGALLRNGQVEEAKAVLQPLVGTIGVASGPIAQKRRPGEAGSRA